MSSNIVLFLRAALEKIGTGLLYGIGFGISAGAFYYFINERMMDTVWSDRDKALENVVVTQHEKATRNGSLLVLGTVENQGTNSPRILTIQVDLYDKAGKFVDQCQEYLRGSLRPGESRHFKVSCGTKDSPPVEHETYKVRANGM